MTEEEWAMWFVHTDWYSLRMSVAAAANADPTQNSWMSMTEVIVSLADFCNEMNNCNVQLMNELSSYVSYFFSSLSLPVGDSGVNGANVGILADDGNCANSSFLNTFC